MMGYFYGYPGGMGFGWLGMILFWVLFVMLIVWLVRSLGGSCRGRNSALDIAQERYARGEITKKEFEQMKKDIS